MYDFTSSQRWPAQAFVVVTGLLLGFAELVLGVGSRSWEHSLVTLMTLVGVWAICRGVSEIFAGFTLRQVGKQAERLVA